MNILPAYLDQFNEQRQLKAAFIPRIPGIKVSTDKWETLARLQPAHQSTIQTLGFTPSELYLAEQVHGADIFNISENPLTLPQIYPDVDGLIASGKHSALLGIYVADCAAIWLHDPKTGAIGLLHSGKKGTEGNIAARALSLMAQHFGSQPKDILAAISPCIHPPLYEVDIAAEIKDQLRRAGLVETHIQDASLCTGAHVEEYYSYRVEKGATGRMLALLGTYGLENSRA